MTKHVLLTGGTGYIGRHVLRGLLREGHAVSAIVRRRDGLLRERLGEVPQDGPLRVLEGDVTAENCGLDAASVAELKGKVDALVHCAGLTEFDAGLAGELKRQNTGGTRRAFELCAGLRAPHFHHMSTAFVVGGPFRNPYEESKFEAERFLKQSADAPVIVSVYRPSIVVGGKVLGEDGSAGTVYAYLKSFRFIRECFRRDSEGKGRLSAKYGALRDGAVWRIPLRIEGDPGVRINLVHVDDVSERVLRGVRRPPGASGTYALASSQTFSADEIKDTFCWVLGMEGVRLLPGDLGAPLNALEEKFRRMTAAFRPYLFSMPSFESGPALRPVSVEGIARDFLEEFERKLEKGKRTLGAMAPDCLDAVQPGKYLDKFSDGQFGESLLKRIPFAEAVVRFRIRGRGDSTRTLVFDKGAVRAGGGAQSADFTYEMDEAVFRRVVTGGLDPREAFFSGELKIQGDQELALKFGYAFTEHFMNIDVRILEELEGQGA